MTRAEMARLMERIFAECMTLREAGQQEYAHDTGNAFANLERIAADLDLPREKVLWTYAMKHRDGIIAWINGHRSQRENVRGRINDLIVYLCLLRGMVEEDEAEPPPPMARPQCPAEMDGRRCDRIAGHAGPHGAGLGAQRTLWPGPVPWPDPAP